MTDPQSGRPAQAAEQSEDSARLPPVTLLVASLRKQLSQLLNGERALLSAELAERKSGLTSGTGMLAGTALLGFFCFAVFVALAVVALALALPAWLSALIVVVVLLLVAGVCVMLGMRKIKEQNDAR